MTAYQRKTLMKTFQAKPYVGKDEKHLLAKSLNVSKKRIMKWFEKRRYLLRRKGLPVEFGEEFATKDSININTIKNPV